MPSASDLTLAREYANEEAEEERRYRRKQDKAEAKDRVEDMVGPKSVGREAMLEKKQLRRQNDRAFRERGDDGFDLDESTTMGGGDSFRERFVLLEQFVPLLKTFSELSREMLRSDATSKRRMNEIWHYGRELMRSRKRRRFVRQISRLSEFSYFCRPLWTCSSN